MGLRDQVEVGGGAGWPHSLQPPILKFSVLS